MLDKQNRQSGFAQLQPGSLVSFQDVGEGGVKKAQWKPRLYPARDFLKRGEGRVAAGYTLIELLIVITVIGLLSGLVITSLSNARKKARDTERISELRQIRNAIELFYAANGYYPRSDCGWDCNGYRRSYDSSWNTLAADLAPYISSLPKDPLNSSCSPWNNNCFSYTYGNVGRNTQRVQYDLTAQFEDTNHSQRCGVKGWRFYFTNVYWCTAFGGSYSNQIYEASLN